MLEIDLREANTPSQVLVTLVTVFDAGIPAQSWFDNFKQGSAALRLLMETLDYLKVDYAVKVRRKQQ